MSEQSPLVESRLKHHGAETGALTNLLSPLSARTVSKCPADRVSASREFFDHNKKAKRKLKIAVVLCFLFFLIELVAGLIAGSLAILSDSFHLLSDIAGFVISLVAIYLSEKPATHRHTFGFHRAEILGAIFSTFLIWMLTMVLVYEAFQRLMNPQPIRGDVMFWTALAGVIMNVVLALTLHEFHGHSHGEQEWARSHTSISSEEEDLLNRPSLDELAVNASEHITEKMVVDLEAGVNDLENNAVYSPRSEAPLMHDHHHNCHGYTPDRTLNPSHAHSYPESHSHSHGHHHHAHGNINVASAALHVLGDLISSIGVLISSIVIWNDPSKTIVDPICTFFFAIIVLITTISFLKHALSVLMEGVPHHIDSRQVLKDLKQLPWVEGVHDLHIWNLSVGKVSFAVHIDVATHDPTTKRLLTAQDYNDVLIQAQNLLCFKYQIHHSTIQIEGKTHSSSVTIEDQVAARLHCNPDYCRMED